MRSFWFLMVTVFIVAPFASENIVVAQTGAGNANATLETTDLEAPLVAILRSNAAEAEIAIACKKLAIVGTAKAVPDLAKLLPNPRLNSWALTALEAIPGSQVDETLRQAATSLSGRELVGVINSIGVRRDAGALQILSNRMSDSDTEVVTAAANAMGRIGNLDAATILRQALQSLDKSVRFGAAEACIVCSEQLAVAGQKTAAMELLDDVRRAEVPKQRIVEATRGAIVLRGNEGLPILLDTLRSNDKTIFQLGLQTIREFPSGQLEQALVGELSQTTPQRAALLIQAMSDRSADLILPTLIAAAQKGDAIVRASAIESLGRIGNDSCVDVLLTIVEENNPELSALALDSLAGLTGEAVNTQLVQRLESASVERQVALFQLIGRRRIPAMTEIESATKHANGKVRAAAIYAAGETVALDRLSWLINLAISPNQAEDQPTAFQALKAASVRMPDAEACAQEIAVAVQRSSPSTASSLLEIISNVGGATALKALGKAAKSEESQLQDTATRLLGTWNSIDAAPVLLDLAKSLEQEKFRVRAIRGYIGLVRKFNMPEEQRISMCRTALETAQRPADLQLVVEVMKLYPSAGMLELAAVADKMEGLENTSAEIRKRMESKGK